ncbi:hypothetical protein NL676_005034 [Syzygium grande]|nr:hypothetical protein NL676_005034 [Syzygium grande]
MTRDPRTIRRRTLSGRPPARDESDAHDTSVAGVRGVVPGSKRGKDSGEEENTTSVSSRLYLFRGIFPSPSFGPKGKESLRLSKGAKAITFRSHCSTIKYSPVAIRSKGRSENPLSFPIPPPPPNPPDSTGPPLGVAENPGRIPPFAGESVGPHPPDPSCRALEN